MRGRKKISVAIPTYNRPGFLRQAIQSLVSQTRPPDDILIGDDNTETDENLLVVSEFQREHPFIRYIRNESKLGSSENYKKLFYLSDGDYVQLMGDDDLFCPEAFETFEYILDSFPEAGVIGSRRLFIDVKSNPMIDSRIWSEYYKLYEELFNDCILDGRELIKRSLILTKNIFLGFPLIRKDLVDFELFKFGNFEFRVNADWFMWMSALRENRKVFLSKKILFMFRIHLNEQLTIEKQIEGCKELSVLLSDDFLRYCGVDLSKTEKATAIENFISGINYLRNLLKESGNEDKIAKLEHILREISQDILKKSSHIVYISTRMKREPFSVIIVTYNNEDTISECLTSVAKTLREEDEIVVVDNDSKDETRKILESFTSKLSNIRCILNSENVFFSKAVNQGVRSSKNRFLVFLNPDTVVLTPDWLNVFYSVLAREDVGAVGPVSDSAVYKSNILRYSRFHWEMTPAWLRYFFDGVEVETKFIPGFCMATRKEVFDKIGGLDEELLLGMDDFDYCLKLRELGLKILILPSVFVKHRWGVSFRKSEESWHVNEMSIINFAKKLSHRFGYGNVPTPDKLFFELDDYTGPYPSFSLKRYRFLFDFSGRRKDSAFFKERARAIRSKPSVAVVVVNHRSSEELRELIPSLLATDYDRISLVVVDNSESSSELERLESFKGLFDDRRKMFVLRSENRGFAAGCNLGINFAREVLNTEFIWLLNPDTVVSRNTPSELVKTVFYTDVPVVTCKMKIYGTEQVQYNGYMASEQPMEDKDFGIFRASFLSGANVFLRADVFDRVGMLREDFFLYFEDNEFFERLKENGIYPLYTPYTSIYHKVRGKYGILERPVHLYYFVRNMFHFFYELTEKRKKPKEFLFTAVEKILAMYFTTLSLNLNTSSRAIVLGVWDFLSGRRGKNERLDEELKREPNEVLAELSKLDIGQKGQRISTENFMKLMKLNLQISPNILLFEKYILGLQIFLFRDFLNIDHLFL